MKGGLTREQLMEVLAKWAAKLAESQRQQRELEETCKGALSYVQQKLRDAEINVQFSDLESLIHKIRNGQAVKEAVEEIINRGVGELRKTAFGDDSEDAKNLPWTREQAWAVLKLLSRQAEVLLNFPFKGDESTLRNMSKPSSSLSGHIMEDQYIVGCSSDSYWNIMEDKTFQAIQEIAYNEAQISSAESSVRSCEEELLKLKDIGWNPAKWFWSDPPSRRAEYLLSKMMDAERKLETLERKNVELKKALAKGG
ncbi:hypothetical protein MPER_03033 [Moniliophthora perniciosa FA553]|nr:hypothetical protein MPER_03033 [Moniliophthora perniciosa FA553]